MTQKKYFFLFLIYWLGSIHTGFSQETNFSQFYNTPMQTNPAMIATSNQFKGVYNYRKQNVSGTTPFTTSNIAATAPYIYKKKADVNTKTDSEEEEVRLLGLGVSMYNDVVGDNGLLKTTGIEAALALNIPLDLPLGLPVLYDSYLSIGLQGGYFQRGLDVNAITTGSQVSSGVFSRGLPTGENFERDNINYTSYGAGIFWYSQDVDEITRAYIGFAVHNINQPDISFLGTQDAALPMRFTLNAGIDVIGGMYTNFSLQPNLRWIKMGNFTQITIGTLARYNLKKPDEPNGEGINLSTGLWYNNANGIVAMVGAENSRFIANISYDMGLLNSQGVEGASAMEATIGVKLGRTRRDREKIDVFQPIENIEKEPEIIIDTLETDEQNTELNPDGKPLKDLSIFEKKVMFLYAGSDLSEEATAFLDDIAEMMVTYETIKISIEGHACNIMGNEADNNRLSLNRAVNVKEYLVSKGIDPQRVITSGYGSTKPIASNDTEPGRVQNRRVEFRVIQE